MSDRKKPNWLLLTTAVLLLPVLYVASFGPACWLADRGWLPKKVVCMAFYPLALIAVRCPPKVAAVLIEYGGENAIPTRASVAREVMVLAAHRVGA
jgi:hypothetical protein